MTSTSTPTQGPGAGALLESSTRLMTGLIGVSRASGVARLLVAVAVLGTRSPLSNVYSSANSIPTIVFEMLAAGALSATLLPAFRRRLANGERDAAARLASSVLVWGSAVLGVLFVIVVVGRARVAGWLLSGIEDEGSRAEARELMSLLIICFMPQLFAYLANTVAVAYLQAQHRFGASVVCPLVNNLVLIVSYVVFWLQRDGAPPSLALTGAQTTTLAGGTLAGVVLMCAVPVADAVRAGFSFARPLPLSHPELRSVVRDGAWAALFLAGGQVMLAAILPITNAHDGHGLVWMVAWQAFLLPHALFAVPVITARFPAMAAAHDEGDHAGLREVTDAGVRSVVATGLLAGALMWALAGPLGQLLAFGAARGSGEVFAAALRPLGPGIAAFGLLHLMARRSYAQADTRTPALVAVVTAVVAIAGTYAFVGSVSVPQRLAVVAWAFTGSNVLGAAVLAVRLRAVHLDHTLARRAGAAVLAAGAAWVAANGLPWSAAAAGRFGAVVTGGVLGVAGYLLADRILGGPATRQVVASLGSAETVR